MCAFFSKWVKSLPLINVRFFFRRGQKSHTLIRRSEVSENFFGKNLRVRGKHFLYYRGCQIPVV
eukprot:UN24951